MNEAIEQVLTRFELVQQAVAIEPRIMQIFAAAANGPYQTMNRWHEYERCKEQLTRLVGWNATNPRLAGSEYYEVCVIAVDYLLPLDLYAIADAGHSALIGVTEQEAR
jgi:hypothetical protein